MPSIFVLILLKIRKKILKIHKNWEIIYILTGNFDSFVLCYFAISKLFVSFFEKSKKKNSKWNITGKSLNSI